MRVGLARTRASYEGLASPYAPSVRHPELERLFSPRAALSEENPVYDAVRASLAALGLDAARFGQPDWNPLGDLVSEGGRVSLKPNFIRHWNPCERGTVESVITHGSVLRAMADYAFLAVGPEGEVEITEAPQMDCQFARIREIVGLDALQSHYREDCDRTLEIIDLRREEVRFEDGVIVERRALPGDPRGYRVVDLGRDSFFEGSGLDPDRLRGADYDVGPTGDHHRDGRNEYLLSESVLSSDLVVNLPKLKTHKKTGVTLALKNLVGINGDKNWLPHHSLGSIDQGGDEFPGAGVVDRLRSRATEFARPLLGQGRALGLFRFVRRMEGSVRGGDFIRAGNWHGNRTTWRMCLDLNRALYYSSQRPDPEHGFRRDAAAPVRRVLTVIDGVVAGEDEGPLAPVDRGLGAVIAACDPVAADLAAVRLMGFDETAIPKIRAAMEDASPYRVTAVRSVDDVEVGERNLLTGLSRTVSLAEIEAAEPFVPHLGWRGHVERPARQRAS